MLTYVVTVVCFCKDWYFVNNSCHLFKYQQGAFLFSVKIFSSLTLFIKQVKTQMSFVDATLVFFSVEVLCVLIIDNSLCAN